VAVILIVEDDVFIRELAEMTVRDWGHHILLASDVDEALSILRSPLHIDALFTDLYLKKRVLGGCEFAHQAIELRPQLRVLYATGNFITDKIKALFVEGAQFLCKPYTPLQLQDSVEHLLAVVLKSRHLSAKWDEYKLPGHAMTNGNAETSAQIGVSEGTDNAARNVAEEALLKAGALQRAIFNSANFSSIATDAKGVIQIFNVGAERMLGYMAGEVMNKITPADISDPQEVIARAKALSAELETTITPGFEALVSKASRGIEDIYDLTYIRKDGSRFPAVVSVTALRDAQGAIIGYLLIGTEIKAGALQRAIFNSANFSSIATDAKGVIQIFNVGAERMLGYAAPEVMNKITPADISDPQELVARAEALSVELGTQITPGFEALVFKASRGIEDIYERPTSVRMGAG
jgi:PAS domain S-box-containing protein